MPTVTAIALETLLEPGSSSSPTPHQHHLRHSTSDLAAPSPSPKDHQNRRHSTSTAWPREHHGRREQQPVFLSRTPREAASSVAGASADGGARAASAAGSRARSSAKGYFISPKLYATPEATRIVPTGGVSSSSPTSVSSPSPYVVNHKRRDVPRPHQPPAAAAAAAASNGNGALSPVAVVKSHSNGFDSMAKPPDRGTGETARVLSNGKVEGRLDGTGEEVVGRGGRGGEGIGKVGEDEEQEENSLDSESSNRREDERPDAGVDDDEEDDFFDPRELMSAVSSSDTEDAGSLRHGGSARCQTLSTSQSEYYDATEDFVSDGSFSRSSPSSRVNIEADLRSIRLNLFEEIDRRKKAEEALDHMQNMFQRVARQLSQAPLPPNGPGGNMQYDVDSAAQFCQEVVVMIFVSEALESSLAHAETEAVAEAIIEAKNHEITRLRDRLQYYEAMNQEMSQRNQEASELGRRRRLKRKVRRRWIWGCIGLSVTVGASLMAYSYLMHGGENPSLSSGEQHDPPSGIASEGSPV